MKIIKKLPIPLDINYVYCIFRVGKLDRCCINGVSSITQTIKKLPSLVCKYDGFYWEPKINLETGEISGWNKNLHADIYFDIKDCELHYLTSDHEELFDSMEIPKYLQLDLIDCSESIQFTVNSNGCIQNWPGKNLLTNLI